MKEETLVSVKLPNASIDRINNVKAKLGGINRSIFIRQAVEEKLERAEK